MNQADQEDRRADEARLATEHETDPEARAHRFAEAEAAGDHSTAMREDGRAVYDSAERRQKSARDLESRGGDGQTVATRMRAAVSQAKPATEAVKSQRVKTTKGREARGIRGIQTQRSDLN